MSIIGYMHLNQYYKVKKNVKRKLLVAVKEIIICVLSCKVSSKWKHMVCMWNIDGNVFTFHCFMFNYAWNCGLIEVIECIEVNHGKVMDKLDFKNYYDSDKMVWIIFYVKKYIACIIWAYSNQANVFDTCTDGC